MAEYDVSPEDFQQEYNSWYEEYGITEWLDNTEENWEAVQKLDPRLVWTNHSTCEDEQIVNGAHMYKNSCCWETFGWNIATVPWEGDPEQAFIYIRTSAYLPCQRCNSDGEGEEPFPELCVCDGEGFIQYFFD